MRKRSTISGFELPTPWAIRTPAPEPERVHALFACGGGQGCDDGAKPCGHHACEFGNCAAWPKPAAPELSGSLLGRMIADIDAEAGLLAPEPAREDALPEGWTASNETHFMHDATGSSAWVSSDCRGRYGYRPNGDAGFGYAATRAEAMAAALGFWLVQGPDGWSWCRVESPDLAHAGDPRESREAAALFALAFDAKQRTAASTA